MLSSLIPLRCTLVLPPCVRCAIFSNSWTRNDEKRKRERDKQWYESRSARRVGMENILNRPWLPMFQNWRKRRRVKKIARSRDDNWTSHGGESNRKTTKSFLASLFWKWARKSMTRFHRPCRRNDQHDNDDDLNNPPNGSFESLSLTVNSGVSATRWAHSRRRPFILLQSFVSLGHHHRLLLFLRRASELYPSVNSDVKVHLNLSSTNKRQRTSLSVVFSFLSVIISLASRFKMVGFSSSFISVRFSRQWVTPQTPNELGHLKRLENVGVCLSTW